ASRQSNRRSAARPCSGGCPSRLALTTRAIVAIRIKAVTSEAAMTNLCVAWCCGYEREADWALSIHFLASGDLAHSPAICLVETLRRFQTLVMEMFRMRAASWVSL